MRSGGPSFARILSLCPSLTMLSTTLPSICCRIVGLRPSPDFWSSQPGRSNCIWYEPRGKPRGVAATAQCVTTDRPSTAMVVVMRVCSLVFSFGARTMKYRNNDTARTHPTHQGNGEVVQQPNHRMAKVKIPMGKRFEAEEDEKTGNELPIRPSDVHAHSVAS